MGVDHRVARAWMAGTLTLKEESNMKSRLFRLLFIIPFVGMLCVAAMPAHAAKIRIVTTLTDLADFARAVGGDLVEVQSLATGVEDTHGVPMKPSFVPIMNRADLLILVGFDCEHSFLPALIEASKNPRLQARQVRLRGLLGRHHPARGPLVN